MLNLFLHSMGSYSLHTAPPVDPTEEPDPDYTFPYAVEGNLLVTAGEGHELYSTFNFDFADQVIYDPVTDCTHMVWMKRVASPLFADNVIVRFNHGTNTFDRHFNVRMNDYDPAAPRDYHVHGVLHHLEDGEILFVCEQAHGRAIRVFKSAGGDIRQMRHIGLLPLEGSYPKIYTKGSHVTVFHRAGRSNYNRTECCVSTDNGETWTDGFRITQMDAGDKSDRHYAHKPIQDRGGHWHLIVSKRRDGELSAGYKYTESYWLVSEDGGYTWRNLQGTFSKNVRPNGSTLAPILEAELQQHFLFASVPHDDVQTVEMHGACRLPNGTIYTQHGNSYENNNQTWVQVYKNGVWTVKPYQFPGSDTAISTSQCHGLYAHDDNTVDMFMTQEENGVSHLRRYRSTDAASSWQLAETYGSYSGTNWHIAPFSGMTLDYNANRRVLMTGVKVANRSHTNIAINAF